VCAIIVVGGILFPPSPLRLPSCNAQAVPVDELRRKQETQQRAAELARELVLDLLDIQLQQLEENGLTDRPLYQDVKTMRQNIDGLIDAEMSDVVTLLLKAQADQTEQRDESFLEARRKIGEVLARLLAERQNLSRRLRTAEVAAQVRRLIDMESVVREVTISLPTQALRQQELQQLSTLADQRDARKLYDKLVETLVEARGWGGEVGRTAVEGLALLKAADTALHFDEAAGSIEMGRFAAAVEHETAAIRGLQVLLKKVKETQGLIQADHRAALEVVRDLMRRQEALLAETKTAPLDDPTAAENLLKKQTTLGKDLERLNEMVLDKPSAAPLVERAQKASEKATVELFNQKSADAAQQQNTVRANLAAVEKQLEDAAADDMPQERDAAQLAQRTADLEATREALKQARAQVQPVAEAATPPTPAAKAPLEQAAKDISRAGQSRDLPRMVDARLRDVVRTAREAAKSIDDPLRDDGAKKQEVQKADAALEQAQAEVEAALADVKRMQPAVAAAELSRAAEALDRAAAAEREVARRANVEAKKPAAEADAAAARELAEEQERVVGVTAAVQEAVAKEAPEAAQPLAEAKAAAENAAMQLAGKEATKPPAAAELKAAAAQANAAAQKLASAASALRRQAAQKAQNLAKETEKQLAALRPAMQAVDQAAMPPTQPNGEAQLALAAAEQALDKAEAEQLRAAGKTEAAAARELADQVEALEQMQQSAAAAAKDHNQGREETPLEAVTKQQETADEIERLAAQAAARPQAKQAAGELKPDPLGDKLAAARKNAQEAAKLTLDGKEPEAQAARKEAAEALAEAAAMAKAEAAEAAKMPAAKPDAAAQQRVSAAIAEAKKNALGHAPLSREPLDKAEEASNDAAAMAGAEAQAAEAAKAQDEAAKNIAQAKKAVEQAQAALAAQGKQRAQQQATAADKLAKQAAQLDPGATEALREAQQAAADGASMPAEPAAAQAAKSEKQTAQALQRAGAELAAREQMVKRDQQLAQAMLNSLAQQQQATQEIAAQRAALQQAMAGKPATSPTPAQGQAQAAAPTPAPPAGPEAEAAARNLNSAMQNFAQAAQVTGQAAQEVAGQSETANTALAQALEQASNFTTPAGANPPPAGEMAAPTAAGQVPLPPPQPEVPVPAQSQLGQTSPQPGELPKTTQMGKGLAPTTPEATAQMMAGPQALEQLAQVETSSSPPKSGSAPGNVATAPSQQATKGQPGPSGKQAQQHSELSSQFAQATESSQPSVNNTGRSAADVAVNGNRPKGDEPWMAKLPAELRAAIRAEAQRPAPRGYEERLRNYFKNVE
jgi:hypothetical protein